MSPEFQVTETTAGLEISASLFPGVRPESVQIVIEMETLKFRGAFRRGGIKFEKRVRVPKGYELAKAWATIEKGVLCVHLPRRQEAGAGNVRWWYSLAE